MWTSVSTITGTAFGVPTHLASQVPSELNAAKFGYKV